MQQFFVNDRCIGCGLCVSLCDDVFAMTAEGVAEVRTQPASDAEAAHAAEALEACPVEAIERR